VLTRDKHEELRVQLAGSSGEVRAALSRLRRFAGAASVSAFCFYFDHVVVVEFSHTGNAAYIYRRADFDAQIEPEFAAGRIKTERDLKRSQLRVGDIKHFVGWEEKAHHLLHRYGVGSLGR